MYKILDFQQNNFSISDDLKRLIGIKVEAIKSLFSEIGMSRQVGGKSRVRLGSREHGGSWMGGWAVLKRYGSELLKK